jgi:SAM-dependent methyltransferase
MSKSYLKIKNRYEDCLRKHGDTAKGHDWPNDADQKKRYRIMSEMIDSGKKSSLLDFGCGTGMYIDFLREEKRFNDLDYTGLDISEGFVAIAKDKYPDTDFIVADLLEKELDSSFDYVIANGVFTVKDSVPYDEMLDFWKKLSKKLFAITRRGFAFNVMSKHVDWERQDLFHLSFDEMASYLKDHLSRHFLIRSDYGLYEYTVYVFKDPIGEKNV